MKQIFMTLATIPFLTFSNNIITVTNSNNITNVKPLVDTNQNNNYLFNNTYHRFDLTNNLITNQSNFDHKFYSYDTSLANYLLKDNKTYAYEVLMVNTDGQLVNSTKVSDEDLAQLNSTKELMNSKVQITSIKDDYNLYSNSQYNDKTYFTGANNYWKYLQFGGFNSHIDISNQTNGNLVENNSNLSESLGLYYIAKAVRTGTINLSVANLLGDYFISKSSFENKITSNLCHTILNLIIKNDEIYDKINQIPLNINSKNYALNYIFDKNNLIAMYYQTWTKELNPLLNYHENITYNDKNSHSFTSGQKRMVNWKQYAKTWDDFSKIFPSITFDPSSHMNVTASGWNYFHDLSKLEIKTKNLKMNMPSIKWWPISTPALPYIPTERITSVGLMIIVTNITITLLFLANYHGDKTNNLWNVNYDININTVILKSIMD